MYHIRLDFLLGFYSKKGIERIKWCLKQILRYFVAFILYYSGSYYVLWPLLSRYGKKNRVLVLFYHSIFMGKESLFIQAQPVINENIFAGQLKYFSKKFNIISMEQFIKIFNNGGCFPSHSLLLTFDDGYLDHYTTAYPLLKKFNAPAVFFITTDLIGTNELFWSKEVNNVIYSTNQKSIEIDNMVFPLIKEQEKLIAALKINAYLKSISDEQRISQCKNILRTLKTERDETSATRFIMNWDEIREMDMGGMTIAAHTLSHLLLAKARPDEVQRELLLSKKIIEEELNKSCNFMSYPAGSFNEEVKRMTKEVNYSAAFTTVQIPVDLDQHKDLFEIPRVSAKNLPLFVMVFNCLLAFSPFGRKRDRGFPTKHLAP